MLNKASTEETETTIRRLCGACILLTLVTIIVPIWAGAWWWRLPLTFLLFSIILAIILDNIRDEENPHA